MLGTDYITEFMISIHALCEEGDDMIAYKVYGSEISIHALCEEGDEVRQAVKMSFEISIHALCEEGDVSRQITSTPYTDFYPRPLRGGRQRLHWKQKRRILISIHALCEEGDL